MFVYNVMFFKLVPAAEQLNSTACLMFIELLLFMGLFNVTVTVPPERQEPPEHPYPDQQSAFEVHVVLQELVDAAMYGEHEVHDVASHPPVNPDEQVSAKSYPDCEPPPALQ